MEEEKHEVQSDEYVVPDYKEELKKIIRSNISPKALEEKLTDYHDNDIANALVELSKEERLKLYKSLNTDTLTNIFEYIEVEDIGLYFSELDIRKKIQILNNLDVEIAANYLKQIGKEERKILIDLIDDEARREIALISSFDDDEIGSKMTTNYVQITRGINVKQAMKEVIEQAAENDNIATIYVVDENKTFCGAIDLKDLIRARENDDLTPIIIASYPYVYAKELIEDCMDRIKNYFEDSIPVLDDDNKLIGVILAQDFVQVVEDEIAEDYAKLAGLNSEEDLSESTFTSFKKRIPWLMVLLGLGMVVSSVVGIFENVVAQLAIVVCFQSLVLDMAGNVGTQSLAVTIRVLMDEELKFKQKLKLIFKEVKVGFVNGCVLGLLSFIALGLYVYLLKGGYSLGNSFAISGCVSAALILSMVVSSLSGTIIPMIFKKLKIDPAVASGPLITTINDLVAVVSYYGLAWIFLIGILGL